MIVTLLDQVIPDQVQEVAVVTPQVLAQVLVQEVVEVIALEEAVVAEVHPLVQEVHDQVEDNILI